MSNEKPESISAAEAITPDPIDQVIRYHVQTKHQFNRYARSAGALDWANQPDPFRRFAGAALMSLPLLKPDDEPISPSYEAIYEPGAIHRQRLTVTTLSRFFELALGLSAWKRAGESEWALRSNPSSGNLHPTEGYVVLPQLKGLDLTPGLYHYAPKEHGLERRAEFPAEQLSRLLGQFSPGAFLFGLTSVHWREAWKYGERAFRYCNHDIGHAIGTARIAAATLGWNMVVLDGLEQNTVALLLGTNRADDFAEVESEHPDCLCVIWQGAQSERLAVSAEEKELPLFLDSGVVQDLAGGTFYGKANRLSREHGVHWGIIDEVAEASWKTQPDNRAIPIVSSRTHHTAHITHPGSLAGHIIRQRRSAVSFDGKTSISAATFFHMLHRVMPQAEVPHLNRQVPWDVWPHDPAIHLMLFVHRVESLTPGFYVLVRDQKKLDVMQAAMSPELNWAQAPGCPDNLPLYWLLEGDAKKAAAQVSCHQDIAGDSAFSLGMLAEFEGGLRERGAWWYPRLFWEAGLVGQVLYLEAEAAGVRGTGIGCFFDDPVHELVGIKDLTLQSLYHFTIGGPVEDRRLMTLPPYFHKQENGPASSKSR